MSVLRAQLAQPLRDRVLDPALVKYAFARASVSWLPSTASPTIRAVSTSENPITRGAAESFQDGAGGVTDRKQYGPLRRSRELGRATPARSRRGQLAKPDSPGRVPLLSEHRRHL